MDTQEIIKQLLVKYFNENLTDDELSQLDEKLQYCTDEEIEIVLSEMYAPEELKTNSIVDHETDRRLENVYREIIRTRAIDSPKVSRKLNLRVLWKISAAACLVIAGIFFFYPNKQEVDVAVSSLESEDVEPASSVALITLGNGEVIEVNSASNGLIYNQDGIEVYQTENGELVYQDSKEQTYAPMDYLTVTTPKGGFISLKLPDGTSVELNAASSIRYKASFDENVREVFAEGEVFFDVYPDKNRPFQVHSEKQTIEVLGTSFNLVSTKTYARTTLIEGKVKIVVKDKDYFLNPGQQAMVSDKVEIKDVNPLNTLAWKNEKFIFDNSSFYEILKEIENWYNVDVVLMRDDMTNIQMSGTVSRNIKISELLKVIEMNSDYKFEVKGRRVYVR